MKRSFTASVSKEGEWHVAQCLEVNVASQGGTQDAALANLREALVLHFDERAASAASNIRRIDIDVSAR